MKEQGGKCAADAATKGSRLPDITKAFVQRAFADGVVEKVDKGESLDAAKGNKWERKKWLLVRYVSDDDSTYEGLKMYTGTTTAVRTHGLYHEALKIIWEASPKELKM